MQITLSKYAGFCEGVERAFLMVEKLAQDSKVKKPILVLGELVHNSEVLVRLAEMGVGILKPEEPLAEFLQKNQSKIGTLVITAHGMGPEIYALAKKLEINLVDATCPKVIKVQRLAKHFFQKNFQLVIIGERQHKEVRGIWQWGSSQAFFVEKKEDLDKLNLDSKKQIAVLSQTTQNQDFVEFAGKYILKKYPEAQILDSVCLATHHRQTEIAQLAKENEVVLVLGDSLSSNSKNLFAIANQLNKNAYFLQTATQLDPQWFENKKTVAITAGASTPAWIIEEVLTKLKTFNKQWES
ncbi:MAG: 4-hydroxy-3-methylbut-2-enyl diphosphate reductase [Candidatus Moraniibacteriota bacterium]